MTTVTINDKANNQIPMYKLEPIQIARVVSEPNYNNNIIMRTQSIDKVEIMNLSNPGADMCWINRSKILVEVLDAELVVNIK